MNDFAEFRVNFADTDAMGVVHHSNYLRYFEVGRVHFLRQKGMDYTEWQKKGWHFPLVEAKVRYRRPCRFDDIVVVKVRPQQKGIRFVFFYEIRNTKSGDLLTTGETHHVCVDHKINRIDPPQEIIDVVNDSNPGGSQ